MLALLIVDADVAVAIAAGEFFSRNFLFMLTALNFLCGWGLVEEEGCVVLEPS